MCGWLDADQSEMFQSDGTTWSKLYNNTETWCILVMTYTCNYSACCSLTCHCIMICWLHVTAAHNLFTHKIMTSANTSSSRAKWIVKLGLVERYLRYSCGYNRKRWFYFSISNTWLADVTHRSYTHSSLWKGACRKDTWLPDLIFNYKVLNLYAFIAVLPRHNFTLISPATLNTLFSRPLKATHVCPVSYPFKCFWCFLPFILKGDNKRG